MLENDLLELLCMKKARFLLLFFIIATVVSLACEALLGCRFLRPFNVSFIFKSKN